MLNHFATGTNIFCALVPDEYNSAHSSSVCGEEVVVRSRVVTSVQAFYRLKQTSERRKQRQLRNALEFKIKSLVKVNISTLLTPYIHVKCTDFQPLITNA